MARRTLGIADETLVAGWVGRLSHEKGADVMVAALAESAPAWHLSVIGDGDELDYLRDQVAKLGAANRVSWHGAIANAGSLMAAFDAFVLSSHTEGTPITLLEAMNAGTPIVATAVGGARCGGLITGDPRAAQRSRSDSASPFANTKRQIGRR